MAQKRAEYALKQVLDFTKGNTQKEKDEFKSFSAGAPAMILQNGLGQALAFWLAKGKKDKDKDNKIKEDDKHIKLFDIVKGWLSLQEGDVNNRFVLKQKDRPGLINELAKMDQQQYLAAQSETLALLEWVKRFAAVDLT
jgi:CRISPR-associated protein Cmr5